MIHPFRPNFDWRELLAVLCPGDGRSAFEAVSAARVGARYGIAFAYARSGIIATCKALGLAEAEIIMPAFTCPVVAEAVVTSGNRPAFVDIDLTCCNMDMAALQRALTPRTRAIIATHMYGYPADVAAIRAMVGDRQVVIIEDAAMLGPRTSGPAGTGLQGDIAVFSFGPGKHLYAVQGGVVATNSASLYEKIKAYRDREMNSLPWRVWAKRLARLMTGYLMLSSPVFEAWNRINGLGPTRHARDKLGLAQVDRPGDYATALADFQGRVGLAQLRKFDSILARHRAWAEFFDRELSAVPGIKQPPIIEGASYSHYTLRVERRDERDFCRQMRAQGIKVSTSFDQVVPYLEAYRAFARGTYPRAEQAVSEVVNLPNYPGLSTANARHVVESTLRSLGGPGGR
jgi:perosamine synthetase